MFLSLINFNPKGEKNAFDDDISTIERVDISEKIIQFILENDVDFLKLNENATSEEYILYKTIKTDKVDGLYGDIKNSYIDFLSKLNSKEYIEKNFDTICLDTLMYSKVISLFKLYREYNDDFVRIRVSD